MDYTKFIKPREIEIGGTTYAISQIPAINSQGIYPVIAECVKENGVLGMTMIPVSACKEILSYVAVRVDGTWFSLDTETRINNYLSDKSTMAKIIVMMVKENWGFLADGSLLDVLGIEEAESESQQEPPRQET